MEQSREPRNTCTHVWGLYVKERCLGQWGGIHQAVDGIAQLVFAVEQDKIRSLPHIRHDSKSHIKI